MWSILLPLTTSFVLCVLLVPGAKILATRIGLIDRPNGRRKIHARPIPMAGGIAILVSMTAALAFGLLHPDLRLALAGEWTRVGGLLLAASAICLLGVVDDFGCLRGRNKLLGQIVVALVLTQFGWVVWSVRFFDWHIDLGILAIPVTICWLLATINSLNLLDGMDGVLGSAGLVMCAALASMGFLVGNHAGASVAAALAGALIGYLFYNFPRANVFLGDAGSMLIGLIVGALAIQTGSEQPGVPLFVAICLLTIPFFDTAAAILRRRLTGRSIYTTDRGHFHHSLARNGMGPRQIVLGVAAVCLVSALGALAAQWFQHDGIALSTGGAIVFVLIASRYFGHVEFCLARDRLKEFLLSLLRTPVPGGARLIGVRLQGTADWQELWGTLLSGAKHLNLMAICLNVEAPGLDEGYHARWDAAHNSGDEEIPIWRSEFPLMVAGKILGRLEFVGRQERESARDTLNTLITLVGYFEAEAADILADRLRPPTANPAETVDALARPYRDEQVTSKV